MRGPEVLPLEQPLPRLLGVEHPLLLLPLRVERQVGRVVQVMQLPPKPQLSPPAKQPFVLPPQPPLPRPLRLRDEDRRPVDEPHQRWEQPLRLLELVKAVRREGKEEPVRALKLPYELQAPAARPQFVQLDDLLVRLPRRIPRVEREPVPLLQARQLFMKWPPAA